MKISQLIKQLQDVQAKKGDVDCYLQSDQEGNGYEEIRGATHAYRAEDSDEYYCFVDTIKEAVEGMGYKRKDCKSIVIVWP
jgi:hypothetical protein